ncbi:MAG: hypothetical protein KKB50_20630 [Planctomycetes bacterium]|nr:hypothetical protein [Planctomycetota bacterium]
MHQEQHETVFEFDTDGDRQADFWQYQGRDGRKHALAYADATSGQPQPRIELDALAASECPHFLIALDGVPFELVEELYNEGCFRLFHPPARVICCFPAMTDLALSELFHTGPCRAYQALRFDPRANRLQAGTAGYLKGDNSPWLAKMAYRCSFWRDGQAYLDPQSLFDHELRGIMRTFRQIDRGEAYAYSVGSAGLGTRGGRAAILKYLRTVDRLCEQIVYERHGRVKLTLSADHGHNLVENRRVSFRQVLEAGGYRLAKSLRKPQDVVAISYGLVTYAAFFTPNPAGVAACLTNHADVEFACYRDGDALIVSTASGHARITRGASGFVYDTPTDDPLRLGPIIEKLQADGAVAAGGELDPAALFAATALHDYPDPLARLWGAFHGLVDEPPDVIVNLRDGACHGSRFFHFMIGSVDSTHGSLNRLSSTTFVLSMLGELPPTLRSADVLPTLARLRGLDRAAAPSPRWGRSLSAVLPPGRR